MGGPKDKHFIRKRQSSYDCEFHLVHPSYDFLVKNYNPSQLDVPLACSSRSQRMSDCIFFHAVILYTIIILNNGQRRKHGI